MAYGRHLLFVSASIWISQGQALAREAVVNDKLPQFNSDLFPEQLFWLAVTFSALFILMNFIALPAVRQTQGKRLDKLSDDLNAAEAANEAAKTMMAQYEKALADARTKAQASVSAIVAEAAKEASRRQSEQQKQLDERLKAAEAAIMKVRETALNDIKSSTSDLAEAILGKVLGSPISTSAIPTSASGGMP